MNGVGYLRMADAASRVEPDPDVHSRWWFLSRLAYLECLSSANIGLW